MRSGYDLPAGDLPNVSDIYSKTELDVSNAEQVSLLESSGFDMWQSSESENNGEDEGEGIEMNSEVDNSSGSSDVSDDEEGGQRGKTGGCGRQGGFGGSDVSSDEEGGQYREEEHGGQGRMWWARRTWGARRTWWARRTW